MTRKLLFTLALLSITFIGATRRTSSPVQRALNNAAGNERAAIARYDAFAIKADEEGYQGAADLFRAASRAEKVHLARFTAVMNERGLTIPPQDVKTPVVGTTSANLQASIRAELAERDNIYLDAYKTASSDNDTDVAAVFDQTRDAEVEHANLCQAAARDLDAMKAPHEYRVCTICGYTTDVKFPLCPSCRHMMR